MITYGTKTMLWLPMVLQQIYTSTVPVVSTNNGLVHKVTVCVDSEIVNTL
jgi:hypothetical protein